MTDWIYSGNDIVFIRNISRIERLHGTVYNSRIWDASGQCSSDTRTPDEIMEAFGIDVNSEGKRDD